MLTQHAKKAGADGALIVAPYYNKPTPEGIFQHFKAIASAVDMPIIVYNIPGRSVIDIKDETLERLAGISGIVGIKDATGDLTRVSSLRIRVGTKFQQLSGEDMTAIAFNSQGGIGCISVTSNIAPQMCAEIQNKTLAGDYAGALPIHDKLMPLHQAMFCETSPGPVKYAASLIGKSSSELRLPLVEPTDASKKRISDAMKQAGIL